MNLTIAVLLTCHNRKDKTLDCLASFYEAIKSNGFTFKIFLVDDGSIDGTASAIKMKYSKVNLINGSGNLFWNKGMRLAWQKAIESNLKYDFFLWLNDDILLKKDAIEHLFDCYNNYKLNKAVDSIIVGACSESNESNEFSYGLRLNQKSIKPNGKLQTGNLMNGNLVLIPNAVYEKIGILSNNYTHAMGDFDYGLRAIEAGFKLITTMKFVAVCETHINLPDWCNHKKSFLKRWQSLHSPLGLNIIEYKLFRKRFWPKTYLISIIKIYFRFLFPRFYNFLNK